ncbi:MAG: DUF4288 domain-containing protein [Acidimicrobiales bacterium]
MGREQWFSASLVVAILTESEGLDGEMVSVVLVRAEDFNEAFEKALLRGRELEEVYTNKYGQRVRWAFVRVETLDMLPEVLGDGVEVHSRFSHDARDSSALFDEEFDPRGSHPDQSGVPPT